MKRPVLLSFFFLMLLPWVAFSQAQGAASMLRFDCSGENAGAEIYINDKFRAECPADIQVQEGTLRLRFYKRVGQRQERVFERELRVGSGTIKRIEVQLSPPRLTAGARREQEELARQPLEKKRIAEEEALEKKRKAEEEVIEKRRIAAEQDKALLDEQIRMAEEGDPHAKYLLARRYASGDGVGRDPEKAVLLTKQSAELGHLVSDLLLTQKFKDNQLEEERKLLKVLGESYVGTNFSVSSGKNSDELLASNLGYPTDRSSRPPFTSSFAGFIAVNYVVEEYGIFSNTPVYSLKLKNINYLIGDLAKPLLKQGGVFGFDLHEEYRNLQSESTVLMHRTMICSKVPNPAPEKTTLF